MKTKVIAVVSGGPDSFCSMVFWLSKGFNAEVLYFDYGHKARFREMETVKRLVEKVNIVARERGWGTVEKIHILDMGFMKRLWRGTQLTDENVAVEDEYKPSVVVPIRNVVMVTIATAYAYTVAEEENANVVVVLGSQYDDVAPAEDWGPKYPDCTPECFHSLQAAFRICHFRKYSSRVSIWTPSMEMMRKRDIIRKCYELVGDLIFETWSCYQGFEKHCGRCESCLNRKRAFREAGIEDKTEYMW